MPSHSQRPLELGPLEINLCVADLAFQFGAQCVCGGDIPGIDTFGRDKALFFERQYGELCIGPLRQNRKQIFQPIPFDQAGETCDDGPVGEVRSQPRISQLLFAIAARRRHCGPSTRRKSKAVFAPSSASPPLAPT